MKVVLANGCFDVLHAGHVWHLKEARAMGEWLIVSLTVDEAVGKGPGFPVNPWEHRATVLRALRCVDEVIPSRNDHEAIRLVRPATFVKGIDYVGSDELGPARAACAEVGASLSFTSTKKLSSREIVRRLRA